MFQCSFPVEWFSSVTFPSLVSSRPSACFAPLRRVSGVYPPPSVLRLWLANLSAAVAPPPEGSFPTGRQSLGLGVLAMVSWHLVPLFRGWFLSCCTCTPLCLSLFLLGCFVPLSTRCHCSLRPPCSLFLLVLRGLLASFIWGVLFLLVVFLPGICLLCFLCFGVLPLIPCSRSLSLRVFPRQVLFLLSLVASPRVGDLLALVAGVFLGGCPVPFSLPGFGRCLSLSCVLSFTPFFCGLSSGRASLVSLSDSSAVLLSCCFFSFLSSFSVSPSTLFFSLPFSVCLQFLLPYCPGGGVFFS